MLELLDAALIAAWQPYASKAGRRLEELRRRTGPGSTRDRPRRICKVRELREAGGTIRGIAAELGCSTYTVQRDLERDQGRAFRRRRR